MPHPIFKTKQNFYKKSEPIMTDSKSFGKEIKKCDSCDQEFDSNASLLRHVSHKQICKDHYGIERIEEMRHEGRLLAKRKWKNSQSAKECIKYERNKCDKINYADSKRRKESVQGKYYSYVSEGVRHHTDGGRAFYKFFKLIYQQKKEEILKDLEQFAYEKYHDKCVDFALDQAFNEENAYLTTHYFEHFELVRNQEYDEEEKLINENWEKSLEKTFNNRFNKRITKEATIWRNFTSLDISQKCDKQTENVAFCKFFGRFESEIFPGFQDDAIDKALEFTKEETKEIEEMDDSDRGFAEHIETVLSRKYDRALDVFTNKVFEKDSDLKKNLEEKVVSMISKHVKYYKACIEEEAKKELKE